MKIRQDLIDNIVSLDLTREQLAKQLLTARYTALKHKAEAEWLGELANLFAGDTESQAKIYDEYQDRITDLMDTYRDRNNE